MKEFENKYLGTFHLEKLMGTGFFGGVFRSIDTMTREQHAIKILNPEHANLEEIKGRIASESKILKMLKHPNIPTFRIAGIDTVKAEVQGKNFTEYPVAYFVMDYVEGKDLEKILKQQGKLPKETVKDYFRQLLYILIYAHKTNAEDKNREPDRPPVYHGDIKPSNMKVADGKLWLLDFGCSRIAGPSFFKSSSRYGYLTLYTAPELLDDSGRVAHEPTIHSDTYSSGMLLKHMLDGYDSVLEFAVNNWRKHGREFPIQKLVR